MKHGTVVGEKFEIRELAGTGAMGVVYRALDLETKRPVAVKLLSALGSADVARFEREASVLERLTHPNIVRYEGRGITEGGRPFLVLEWLDGETLSSRLAQVVPTIGETLGLLRTLSRALAHAHAQGVVHRDIKPANVFLLGSGFSEPRLLDFGVARLMGASDMTRTGMALGTPVYMAPEQARGRRDVDSRVDLYALGCLLFECLTGRPPFQADDVMAVLAKVLFADPPSLAALVPAAPDALDELTARLLDKEPSRRPGSAEELAVRLEAIEADMICEPDQIGSSTRPPRPLTSREQKLVAVVAVAQRGEVVRSSGTAATLAAEALVPITLLATQASQFNAAFSPLANGSCIALLESDGSASDLALRAARCALTFRAHCEGLPIALVMGRATTGRVPVGEVIDRVVVLLRQASGPSRSSAVVIDELAARLLDRRFEVTYTPDAALLISEREEPSRKGFFGVASPFVGRNRELRMLRELFEEATIESTASVAMVTGAAGVGKTRLVDEWLSGLSQPDGASEVEVWIGRSDPLAAGSPLGLIASAVRSAARVVRGDVAAIAQRKLRSRVAQDVVASDVDRITHFLAEIIGAPFPDEKSVEIRAARTDPTLMGDQLRRAFAQFVDAVSASRPLVLVLEDAHWGDAASVRVIEAALRQTGKRPVLVCAVGRLDSSSALTGLSSFRGALHLSMGELPRRACREFVDAVLPDLGETLRQSILEQASGNPFFLEELVRYVAEDRAKALLSSSGVVAPRSGLPLTVLAASQARLQALPANARRVLRGASIFGHAFWPAGVLHLLGATTPQESVPHAAPSEDTLHASLEELVVAELVDRRSPSRFPGKDEYIFRQGLVRDAAYSLLTDRDRSAGHQLAGEWLEAQGELDSLVLAEHLQRGLSGVRAAHWFTRAATKALDGNDFHSAILLAERGRAAAGPAAPPDLLGALLLVEAEARGWSGDLVASEAAARLALEVLPRGTATWFHASAQLCATAGSHGDFRPLAVWREQIAVGASADHIKAARLKLMCVIGRRLYQLGDYDAANELVEVAQREYDELATQLDPRTAAEVLRLFGSRARHSGDVAADHTFYGGSLEAFERAGDARGACNALVSVGFSCIQLGDYARARVHLERARSEAAKLGLASVETRVHQNLSLVLLAEGRPQDALESALRVAQEAKSRSDARFQGWTLIYASRAALAHGDAQAAHAHAKAAAAGLMGSPPAYAGALAAQALALVALGDAVEADLCAGEAMAILGEYTGIEEFESLVHLASIRAALAVGDTARGRGLLFAATARLELRASRIVDAALRTKFLQDVSENEALTQLSRNLQSDDTGPAPSSKAIWSDNSFRADADLIVARLAQHIEITTRGEELVTRGFPPPDVMFNHFSDEFLDGPSAELPELLERILAFSPHQHHPRYVGHQVSSALPRAALMSLVGAVLNNGMAAFESGPASTTMERRVVEWMVGLLGWRQGGGVLTSGGSLGNLTALLAVRQAKARFDVKANGLAQEEPLALLVSEQVHYSIERAAQIMGLGRRAVIAVRVDERYRLDPHDIQRAFDEARASGARPIAVVASAGATGTGSIDPLDRIADECERLGLWLHVDGAHGASALLSPRYGPALRGIERADSVVWDAHKLLSMPALVTGVLFKDGRAPYETFAQDAAYLFQGSSEGRWFDIGLRTIECTKPLQAIPLYTCLATLGVGVFRDALEHAFGLARDFARTIDAAPDFELACMPDSNIVCFRHRQGVDLNARQRNIVAALRAEGRFYCVMTTLKQRVFLRVSLMNPLTTSLDLAALLDAIRAIADEPGPA